MAAERGPIGVFDSGVGGLTVVKEIRALLPLEDILYFGDTARVPYGNKSPETIVRYSLEVGKFLVGRGVSVLVVACNTSSSLALDALKAELPVPVLGMIEPGAKGAVIGTRNGKVGLAGTRATVRSGAYGRAIAALDPSVQVFSQACPLFVPLVEEGWAEDPLAEEVARRYLDPLVERGIDTLILGCTHYPVLVPSLKKVLGEGITLVSSAETAAKALYFITSGMAPGGGGGNGSLEVFVTDYSAHFQEIAERILQISLPIVHKIEEERLVVL